MKARKYAIKIHLALTIEEFDYLGKLLGGRNPEFLDDDIWDSIYEKMLEIKKRLDTELPDQNKHHFEYPKDPG